MSKSRILNFVLIALFVLPLGASINARAETDPIVEAFKKMENASSEKNRRTPLPIKPKENEKPIISSPPKSPAMARESGAGNAAATEAGIPCITCLNRTTTPSNLINLRAVSEKVQELQPPPIPNPPPNILPQVSEAERKWKEQLDFNIHGYSTSKKTDDMIEKAMANSHWRLDPISRKRLGKRNPLSSTGNCFRHVKDALLKSKLVSQYPAGYWVNNPRGSAKRSLEELGFVDLLSKPRYNDMIKNPSDAPKGAVLIYSGPWGENPGHIEIKTDWGKNGTYVSDFQAPKSVTQNPLGGRAGSGFKLIGVMVKPGG